MIKPKKVQHLHFWAFGDFLLCNFLCVAEIALSTEKRGGPGNGEEEERRKKDGEKMKPCSPNDAK